MSVVSIVYCQVEIPATSRSIVQRIPTDCDSSLCVISEDRETQTVGLLVVLYGYETSQILRKNIVSTDGKVKKIFTSRKDEMSN